MTVSWSKLALPIAAMAAVVAASNVLVRFPLEVAGLGHALTWGAVSYPFAFLVSDLTNRRFGASATRRMVWAGFAVAVVASFLLATPRIAAASGTAFLAAQLLDVAVFDRLRRAAWWKAPLASSLLSSAVDTAIFFTAAFAGDPAMGFAVPTPFGPLPLWVNLALWDWAVKIVFSVVLVAPYGWAIARVPSLRADAPRGAPAA